MPTIINPFDNKKVVDLTSAINVVPNQWGMYERLGIFRSEYLSQRVAMIPRTTQQEVILEDKNWDERNNTFKTIDRDVTTIPVPHFPGDDAITPNDLSGVVDWDSALTGGNGIMRLEKVRASKMEVIRKSHALTLEFARAQIIRDGTVYAPNGTVNTNFYTEFGVTRQIFPFNLASTTVNPLANAEAVIAYIQDNIMTGDYVTDIMVLCSPEFFSALISNPFVHEAYQYFSQTQGTQILSGRLTSPGPDPRGRTFIYGGLTFVEQRGQVLGQKYITPGEAYAFPMGTDSFKTFWAPAQRFSTINAPASESYYFEYMSERDDIIEIMSETNFTNALLRPQVVVTLRMGTA